MPDRDLIQALADVYADGARAHRLLTFAEVPKAKLRPWGDPTPLDYWTAVVGEIEKGVMHEGLLPLVRIASEDYPGNAAFQAALARLAPGESRSLVSRIDLRVRNVTVRADSEAPNAQHRQRADQRSLRRPSRSFWFGAFFAILALGSVALKQTFIHGTAKQHINETSSAPRKQILDSVASSTKSVEEEPGQAISLPQRDLDREQDKSLEQENKNGLNYHVRFLLPSELNSARVAFSRSDIRVLSRTLLVLEVAVPQIASKTSPFKIHLSTSDKTCTKELSLSRESQVVPITLNDCRKDPK